MSTRLLTITMLLLAAGILMRLFSFSNQGHEERIKREIVKANYCEVAADCQMAAQSACPFGCYIFVNKNEAARIGALIEGYQSTCMYSCIQFQGVDCINNTCQVVQ
jgi:hypothetical protein